MPKQYFLIGILESSFLEATFGWMALVARRCESSIEGRDVVVLISAFFHFLVEVLDRFLVVTYGGFLFAESTELAKYKVFGDSWWVVRALWDVDKYLEGNTKRRGRGGGRCMEDNHTHKPNIQTIY